MQHAFGHGLVDGARGALKALGGLIRIANGERFSHAPNESADARPDGLVPLVALQALSMALLCRGMFVHGLSRHLYQAIRGTSTRRLGLSRSARALDETYAT